MIYYRYIQKTPYEAILLKALAVSVKRQEKYRLSGKEIQNLWKKVQAGGRITAIEKETLSGAH